MVFRRGNKSSKVPNVKLRPAAPNSSLSSRKTKSHDSHDSFRGTDSGFDSEQEASLMDMRIPRPFRGVVLCATGISDKMSLFKQAIELGAQPLNDLTDKVTHLLALEPGSAKYKCALEFKIPIMHPSWISDSYDIWLKGDDVDLDESVRAHRLPIFDNVVVCVSGQEDVERRQQINARVRDEGGSYVKNIERPVRVTHLLCSSGADAMTEKMQYAAKFNKHREANIRMIWEEWFWDSLRAGGRCDEDSYDITKPRPIRGPSPEPATPPPRSSPGITLDETNADKEDAESRPNEDVEEAAVPLKRVPSVTLQIWESMLRPRGFEIQAGKLMRTPTKPRYSTQTVVHLEESPTKGKGKARATSPLKTQAGEDMVVQQRSILVELRRAHSSASHALSQPLKKTEAMPTHVERIPAPDLLGLLDPDVVAEAGPSRHRSGFFAGCVFRIVGEARSAIVKTAVEEAGGKVVGESSDEVVDFIIVRLVSGSKIYREEVDESSRKLYRTECWLEHCFSESRVCSPDEHISFTPLRITTPILGTQSLSLSISGLEESEACWVRRLVRALGINFAPSFSRRTTHLLCPSRTGAKHDKAKEWNIPIIDMGWLEQLVTSGQLVAHDDPIGLAAPNVGGKQMDMPPAVGDNPMHITSLLDTTNLEATEDDEFLSAFGQPVGLLQDTSTPVKANRAAPSEDGNSSGQLSLAELREDMQNTHIPSSETPSPMKPPSTSRSPAKISKEATRVLQESITSLLGKRMSSEEIGAVQPRSKRVRPPSRTKVQTRNPPSLLPEHPPGPQDPYEPFGVAEEDVSMLAAESPVIDDTVRVTYEDPAQNSEKLRLMKLLETQKPPEVWELGSHGRDSVEEKPSARRRRAPPRRSNRVAGF